MRRVIAADESVHEVRIEWIGNRLRRAPADLRRRIRRTADSAEVLRTRWGATGEEALMIIGARELVRPRNRAVAFVLAVVCTATPIAVWSPPASPAPACSCGSSDEMASYGSADVVFAGTVEQAPDRAVEGASDRLVTWSFMVYGVYKGEALIRQEVLSAASSVSCGIELSGEGPFLVFARRDPGSDGALIAGLCGGTRPILGESPELGVEPYAPVSVESAAGAELEAATGSPGESAEGDRTVGIVVASGVGLLLVAAVVIAIGRRRRSSSDA